MTRSGSRSLSLVRVAIHSRREAVLVSARYMCVRL
jgi:hypothetical protein